MFSAYRTSALRSIPRGKVPVSRNFATSGARLSHGPEGPYSNLPFAVHNRKIPYGVLHFVFGALGLGVPAIVVYWNLKKSGSL